jgi:hypothetical protein
MGRTDMAPYLAVLSLTRSEGDLMAAGDWQGVVRLGAERTQIDATRPTTPPDDARELVDQALAHMQMNLAQAVATRDHTRATLIHLADGRRALHAYAGTAPGGHFDARS